MRSLVMTISIMNKFYAISHDDEKNSMVAIGLDKNKHFYPVTSEEELKLINSIIDKNIRKVFFELGTVSFEGRDYISFQNRYDSKIYFSLAEDEEKKILDYSGNERLYDYYNPKNIIYIYNNGFDNFDINSDFGFGDDPFGYTPTYNRPKKSNIGKKIAIGIAGVTGAAAITIGGIKLYTNFKAPHVIGNDQAIVVEGEAPDYGLQDIDVEPVEDEKLTEDQIKLRDKYDRFKKELEDQKFKPWEIAVILSEIKQQEYIEDYLNNPDNAELDQISFFYDSENDTVVYVYGDIDRTSLKDIADVKTEETYDYESLSEEVKALVDAVNNNPNLTEDQKQVIIEKFSGIWQKNIKYYLKDDGYYYDELLDMLNVLGLEIKDPAEGRNVGGFGNPHVGAAGSYDPDKKLITEYGYSESVTRHEAGHAIGNFGYGNTLLNEGYNEWKNGDNSKYDTERFMAYAFEEVFGEDTLGEAYARHNLSEMLTDKLVEEGGMERDEAEDMVYNLLYNTQSALYDLGTRYDKDKSTALDDEDLCEEFAEIFDTLEDINSKLGQPPNLKIKALRDFFTNNRDSELIQSDDEQILSFRPTNDGSMLIRIGTRRDYYYHGGATEIGNNSNGRYKLVTQDSITGNPNEINDYELDYTTPHKFEQSAEEGKDGLEDCMEDEKVTPSIIQRIKDIFSSLFHKNKDKDANQK